ncbi:MAG: DNA polymerase III subunit epsilon [Hyphomicrobiales bacterium]|nr:DNA polymerase III subunit epsilon [Hyphomicrobiales bacterium]
MREIVFDTETTGLAANNGDRVVEIGCVELFNHISTGETFHRYVNPERSMPFEAQQVHGLTDAFLSDKPVFAAIADELLAFLGDAPLIAHNADFDLAFLNAEFIRCGRPQILPSRIIDSLMLARRKHPAGPNSLDALCSRYFVDTSRRTFHGALLDSELLAEVYVELIGGRQASLGLADAAGSAAPGMPGQSMRSVEARPVARAFRVTEDERAAHRERLARLGENAIWLTYLGAADAPAITPTAG